MITNTQLQKDVQKAIKFEPSIIASEIGVTAKDGVIVLSGTVSSYSKKLNAEIAAKKVRGVRAIAVDITVDDHNSYDRNDAEIAKDILVNWKNNWEVPQDRIHLVVKKGIASLEGEVTWKYQEEAAKDSIRSLPGLKGINNKIKVKSVLKDILEKVDVENALARNWSINSEDVKVEVDHNNVKLKGIVRSLYQKDEAGRLAWNAPGVWSVDNELAVID